MSFRAFSYPLGKYLSFTFILNFVFIDGENKIKKAALLINQHRNEENVTSTLLEIARRRV